MTQSKTPAKILFIGIDACDKDLILKWVQEGKLPTFKSLLEKGAHGITLSPEAFYVGAIWPSFMTANTTARHKRYCFKQLKPGTYQSPRFKTSELKGEMFWDALSQAGKRVAILDVPKSPLSQSLNGMQLRDWACHDAEDDHFSTYPQNLKEEIENRFGHDTIGSCDIKRESAQSFIELRDALLERTRKKGELSRFYLKQGGWDLFLTIFCESHCAGHQFWHITDPKYPRYNEKIHREVGNPILDVYKAADDEISQLMQQAGPDCNVFVFASHGMGPHYEATYLLETMLRRIDRATDKKNRKGWNRIRMWIHQKIERPLKKTFKNRYHYKTMFKKYFKVYNNTVFGGVRINLKGREPFGFVNPGTQYERVCEKLIQDLMAFTNVETGRPLVKRILRSRDLFPTQDVNHLPDLLVEWNREQSISVIHSPKTGTIRGEYKHCRTGDHKREGYLFAVGPDIRAGELKNPVSVMDIAPTLAELLGTSLPNVDGRSFLPTLQANAAQAVK